MKSQFKGVMTVLSLFSLSPGLEARDVILIENLATQAQGQALVKIIQEKFKIPRKLITYRNVDHACSKNSEAIMQLCLKPDGDMDIVKINKFVVENSLRVFQETEDI